MKIIGSLLLCFYLFLPLLIFHSTSAQPPQSQQQEGFVSLRCCAPSNITDPDTKLRWISDLGLFQNKGKCQNISMAVVNDSSYNHARLFGNNLGNKWCYNLTTTKGLDYLIRETFLHSLILRATSETIFDISIDATTIGTVNSSVDSTEIETVFRAPNDHINICLVRRKGNAYMSMLELRPLNQQLAYSNLSETSIFNVVKRMDIGNTVDIIRYPYDPNDRIWNVSDGLSGNAATSISNFDMAVEGANATVPLQVLQTAIYDPEKLELLLDDLEDGDNKYLVYLYFLELNSSVTFGQRVFDIYTNGVLEFKDFSITQQGNDTTTNYREIAFNVTANQVLNVSLIRVSNIGLELGPICNAYEVFQVQNWTVGTRQKDVDAIVGFRDQLVAVNPKNEVLGGWSGDPCLPLPWQGLLCESSRDGSSVITQINIQYYSLSEYLGFDELQCKLTSLDLSFNDLQGSLPPIITELIHLKNMNLSYNRLTGTIPSFPQASALTSIDLRHNDLLGPFPESLVSVPHLTRLCYGCNPHFGDGLPPTLLNRSNFTTDFGMCDDQGSSHSSKKTIIGGVVGGSLLFAIAVGVIFLCVFRRRLLTRRRLFDNDHTITKNAIFSVPSMDDLGFKSISIQAFTLESIEIATNKYKALIGEGGFGSVYRGTLPDGQEVAVKVRSATSSQGTREFENELNLLSAMRNDNLVPLLGYCCEFDQQILVYPFMSNGSLQDRLYGEASKRKVLDWPTRLSIALGAARGLLYLHTFAGRCIIHRDVKSSNILLDQSMTARVADFGFSKYAPQEGDSGASLEVRGTAGYLDPEYYSTQHLSVKSDVFSFGVVLLEIISGREPLNIHRPRSEWSLVEWAKPFIRESRIDEIVDPSIKAGYHAEAMWRVVEVALACIEPFSAYRPCMVDIVRELEDALIIENNASEYMKSIDSFGGSNRFSIEKKVILPVIPAPTEPSPIISQALAPPQPR